jgi:hypothetical protein
MRFLGALALAASSCGVVTGIDVTALPTTADQASPFTLADGSGQATALSSLLARGDVALIFFRGHW